MFWKYTFEKYSWDFYTSKSDHESNFMATIIAHGWPLNSTLFQNLTYCKIKIRLSSGKGISEREENKQSIYLYCGDESLKSVVK